KPEIWRRIAYSAAAGADLGDDPSVRHIKRADTSASQHRLLNLSGRQRSQPVEPERRRIDPGDHDGSVLATPGALHESADPTRGIIRIIDLRPLIDTMAERGERIGLRCGTANEDIADNGYKGRSRAFLPVNLKARIDRIVDQIVEDDRGRAC